MRNDIGRAIGMAALAIASAGFVAGASADELHKKDGTILFGRLESESASAVKFVEVGKKKAASFDKKDVRKVLLTYALPDFVYSDPKWSKEMVDARVKQAFEPDWGKVETQRSAHYILFTNSSAGDKYLATMEELYDLFKKLFPFEEPKGAALLPVFLFKTTDQYFASTRRSPASRSRRPRRRQVTRGRTTTRPTTPLPAIR